MVKFCPECRNPIIDITMSFCPKCGSKLPITSPEGQPSPAHQQEVPSYYTPPKHSVPTTYSEPQSSERSFYYSNIFYIVTILDIIVSVIFGIGFFNEIVDLSNPAYNNPFALPLLIILLINLIIDLFIINNMRNSSHTIDINLCWIKSLFGFLGIITVISGLYILIISISMKRAYDKMTR